MSKLLSLLVYSSLILVFVGCGNSSNSAVSQKETSRDIMYSAEAIPASCTGKDACICGYLMSETAANRSINVSDLNGRLGGTPRDMFTHGGSMNIPVMCRSAHYYMVGDRSWFNDYFDVQKEVGIGFMGREIGSPLYGPLVAGAVLHVRKEAVRRGHTDTANKAAEWLRAYWAFHALSAVAGANNSARVIQQSGVVDAEPGTLSQAGVVVASAATRRGKGEGMGSFSLTQQLMAMATNLPRRTGNISQSHGFSGGLRTALHVAGYTIASNGHVPDYSQGRDAAIFGLSNEQRQDLRDFLTSNGQSKLNTIVDMLRGYKPACHMTFLRTSEGASSWFGTNTATQRICNRNKGPYFAARVSPSGNSLYLAGTNKVNPAEGGESYRDGNRVCARVDGYNNPLCMNLPQGERIYEIEWIVGSGINIVYGGPTPTPTPTPGPTPTPTPTPGPTPTPTPPPTIPPPPSIGNCGSDVLCLHNGRYKVVATWYNQYNGQSGRAGVIPDTNYAGFLHFGDAANFELMIKILDFGGAVKIFYGQLTNLRFYLYVKDTTTGVVKSYTNTPGDCGDIDHNPYGQQGSSVMSELGILPLQQKETVVVNSFNCTPNETTMCLQDGRIKITGSWRNQYNNESGTSGVRKYSNMSGGLYFTDPNNLELVIKALDFGTHYLIMYGAMSDLEYQINVTDVATGRAQTYSNPAGRYCGGIDSQSFPK